MKTTITSELRKSIAKVASRYTFHHVFSDPRKKGLAVGVKVCGKSLAQETIQNIVDDMARKGYVLAYVRRNENNGYYGRYWVGTRFCFFKK